MLDLTFMLQTETGKCLYEQIYEHIRDEIREGKLLHGEKLPSTRFLAEYLQVARSTVEYAYDQLVSEGYIESKPCKGYFVCKLEGLYQPQEVPVKKKEAPVVSVCEYRYDFSPNGIDMSAFPYSVWKKIHRDILNENNGELFQPGSAQGEEGLRRSIASYLYASRGAVCSPDQIIVGAGNDYLLLLLEKILGRNVSIAMENPTYKRAWRILHSWTSDMIPVAMDENGMKVKSLEKSGATVAYVMPSHQYPTGIVMPVGRRGELLKWAGEAPGRYIIEDDYDSEFRYKGKPIPALVSSDLEDRVIYIGTFSKVIAPAIRISYMVLPEPLLEKYRTQCYFYSSTVSRIDQTVLQKFMDSGSFERHLNKMRKLYKNKHDYLLDQLTPFLQRFRLSGENAGLHILLTDKKQESEEQLVQKAGEQGVRVYGLSEGKIDRKGRKRISGTVILGYGGMTEQEIREGIEQLKKAWM